MWLKIVSTNSMLSLEPGTSLEKIFTLLESCKSKLNSETSVREKIQTLIDVLSTGGTHSDFIWHSFGDYTNKYDNYYASLTEVPENVLEIKNNNLTLQTLLTQLYGTNFDDDSFGISTPELRKSSTDSNDSLDKKVEHYKKSYYTALEKNNRIESGSIIEAQEAIIRTLSLCNVLVIGEGSHEDNAVADVLFETSFIQDLKRSGLGTIFTEHLYHEHIELLLSDPERVVDHLDNNAFMRLSKEYSPAKKMVSFLQSCKTQGITIIALDDKEIYKHHAKDRVALLNHKSIELIQNIDINDRSKVLIYIGASHSNHHNDKRSHVIGITEALPESEEIIIKYSYSKLDLSSVKNGLVFGVDRA